MNPSELISLEKISEAREIGVKRFNEMGGPANWAEMNSINTSRHELNLLENVVENYSFTYSSAIYILAENWIVPPWEDGPGNICRKQL